MSAFPKFKLFIKKKKKKAAQRHAQAGLTRTRNPRVPPRRALHHPGPEDGCPPRQLGQGLRIPRHRRAEVHPRRCCGRGSCQAVYPRKPGQQLPGGGNWSPQDVAYSVRGPPGELRVEVGQRRRLEARRALLQRVREQGRLHLGHVVQRRQRGAAQDESTLPVSLHLPDR